MKPLTEQNLEDYTTAIRRGALEGGLAGTAVAASASWYFNRHWAAYRRAPLSLKAFGGVIIIAPLIAVRAERRGLQYDRSQWEGATANLLGEKQEREEAQWQRMSTRDKLGEWAERHQYTIILGGWATSLATAAGLIWRNKYQTPAQKIVQARMWAQGLTIGLLIVAGALTHSKRTGAHANVAQPDHSWVEVLEQHEKERQEAEQYAHANNRPLPRRVGRDAFAV